MASIKLPVSPRNALIASRPSVEPAVFVAQYFLMRSEYDCDADGDDDDDDEEEDGNECA